MPRIIALARLLALFVAAVVAASDGSAARSDEAWTTVAPENGGYRLSFPQQPELKTQTINGIANNVYLLEAKDGVYAVSSFEIPANMRLTLDTAVQAFAAARKATVDANEKVMIGRFQGREAYMTLPNESAVRMVLVAVGRRHYQLLLEGSSEAVRSSTANKFFASFKLD